MMGKTRVWRQLRTGFCHPLGLFPWAFGKGPSMCPGRGGTKEELALDAEQRKKQQQCDLGLLTPGDPHRAGVSLRVASADAWLGAL